ncbi:MAG: 30S ribosomal protein S20 [Bdellovibrionales bacterium CG10_big_fil_rev_8_21_14_0_10_45_34]|nr:MAG: 30S ribosomal protein S20 [Bdellovibrionales bacterium CG10_big_fil_rev_8_21_14_0_10_45_34]
MATHKSAEKRARQAVRRNAVNTRIESTVRTLEKKVREAIKASDKSLAGELLKDFMSKAQKAGNKGVVHYKSVSRKISRLSQQLQSLTK